MIETEVKKIAGNCIHLLYPNSCSESGFLKFCRDETHFRHHKICWWIHGIIIASSALGDNPGRFKNYRAEVGPDTWVFFDLRPSKVAFLPVNELKRDQANTNLFSQCSEIQTIVGWFFLLSCTLPLQRKLTLTSLASDHCWHLWSSIGYRNFPEQYRPLTDLDSVSYFFFESA